MFTLWNWTCTIHQASNPAQKLYQWVWLLFCGTSTRVLLERTQKGGNVKDYERRCCFCHSVKHKDTMIQQINDWFCSIMCYIVWRKKWNFFGFFCSQCMPRRPWLRCHHFQLGPHWSLRLNVSTMKLRKKAHAMCFLRKTATSGWSLSRRRNLCSNAMYRPVSRT